MTPRRSFNLACALVGAALVTPFTLFVPFARAVPGVYALSTMTRAWSINATGQVAGQSDTAVTPYHALRYTGIPGAGGVLANLGTLGTGSGSNAYGLSPSGMVVGASYTAGFAASRAFLYTGTPGSGGAMANLGTLGGDSSYAYGVNNSGKVVGYSGIAVGQTVSHAFLYSGTPGNGGAMADLGTLGGTNSYGFAINASGQVTGNSNISPALEDTHAFLYSGTPGSGGSMVDLGTLGGNYSYARSINDSGQVTGYSILPNNESHAFLYSSTPGNGGAMIDLGTLGDKTSIGHGINAAGQVVGESYRKNDSSNRRAFLYRNGGMIDLDMWLDVNNPAEGAKWVLKEAWGISDNGLVTGSGTFNGVQRAFLLDISSIAGGAGGGTWLNAGVNDNTWSAGPNWSLAATPGSTGAVTFATNSTYTVNFTTAAAANTIAVSNGNVTLALGTRMLTTAGNVSIADVVGQSAVVNISGSTGGLSVGQNLIVGGTESAARGAGTLSIGAGGKVTVVGFTKVYSGSIIRLTGGTLKTGALNFTGTLANPTGKVDIAIGSALIVDYSGASPASDIKQLVKAGRGTFNPAVGNFNFDGQGITSSAAGVANVSARFARYAVGVIDNADLIAFNSAGYSTFAGFDVDADSVLTRATYNGDANLDGRIDSADFSLINRGFAGSIANVGWLSGDFTFDGLINADDYAVIDFGYLSQGAALSSDAPVAVPEPIAILIPSVLAGLMIRRRSSGQ